MSRLEFSWKSWTLSIYTVKYVHGKHGKKYLNILHPLFLPQFQNLEFLQAGKHGNVGLRIFAGWKTWKCWTQKIYNTYNKSVNLEISMVYFKFTFVKNSFLFYMKFLYMISH
jgi:hypothetical protein